MVQRPHGAVKNKGAASLARLYSRMVQSALANQPLALTVYEVIIFFSCFSFPSSFPSFLLTELNAPNFDGLCTNSYSTVPIHPYTHFGVSRVSTYTEHRTLNEIWLNHAGYVVLLFLLLLGCCHCAHSCWDLSSRTSIVSCANICLYPFSIVRIKSRL